MKKGKKTAILGPHIHSTRDLMSDYKGDQQCAYEGKDWVKHGGGDYDCFPTIAQAFVRANGAANTVVSQGVEMDSCNSSGIADAVAAAQEADQVLLFIGIGNHQEHEAIDRMNTSLPGLQAIGLLCHFKLDLIIEKIQLPRKSRLQTEIDKICCGYRSLSRCRFSLRARQSQSLWQ